MHSSICVFISCSVNGRPGTVCLCGINHEKHLQHGMSKLSSYFRQLLKQRVMNVKHKTTVMQGQSNC